MSEDDFDNAPTIELTFNCPQRGRLHQGSFLDGWRIKSDWYEGYRTCTYCGSINPEDFLVLAAAGKQITPTDKSYKAYISLVTGEAKFYYEHFSAEQQDKFATLYNEKKLKLAHPGFFYVLPFFCKPKLTV